MKTLVIVESPTKAKTIAKFLGPEYTVTSSFGHIRDLPKSKMGIDIENGTFLPQYVIPKDKAEQVKKIKDSAKKSDGIIFATDEDREGEAISWHLAHILKIEPQNAKRIVFHEITKSAIQEALANPRHIDEKLVDAQQARRVLDRLVGYELSPFLWKKIARGLSAGRVQSVALRIIVEREREIEAFVAEEYWTLTAIFSTTDGATFEAKLATIAGKKIQKMGITTQTEMTSIVEALTNVTYSITEVTNKPTKRNPLPAFTTSTLQQQANNRLHFSSKKTMRIAQQLYEGLDVGEGSAVGLITYMRTDSVHLSERFLTDAQQYLLGAFGEKYVAAKPRVFKTKSKGAQEAHEAIRPTLADRNPENIKQYLTPDQFKLYDLIWRRALASQMAEAQISKSSIVVESNNNYGFKATGQVITFDGWIKLFPASATEKTLPTTHIGDIVAAQSLTPEQHFTEPPPRYSDASLVKILEEHGIGRPSTYAPTISTLENRKYVEREGRSLKPTDIGKVVNDLLVAHFQNIVDFDFTAQVEAEFDDIAHGQLAWRDMIRKFYTPFHEHIEQKKETISKEEVVGMRELGVDPVSGKPIFVRVGRFGPFVQKGSKDDEEKPTFAALEPGQTTDTITLEEALHLLSLPRILGTTEAGESIITNRGKYGPYVQIGKKYYSLHDAYSPYTITLEEAQKVIAENAENEKNKYIKEFENSSIQVKNGRFGPYVTDGTKNAKIPKDVDPATLTLEQCEKILAEKKPGRTRRKAATPKKKATTKKKTTKKKSKE